MGGYVADGFQNTVDWIIRKDTEFPGDPPSAPGQPGNIRIRKDIYSLESFLEMRNQSQL